MSNLGYTNDSIFSKLHSESDNLITLTLNTDGMVVYKKGHISAWPFYLTINELPMVLKYKIKNVIISAIYIGYRKIDNLEAINKIMHQISSFRNNVEIKSRQIQIEVIYGAFNKPARSLALNCQSSNAFYGCVFCTQILQTNSKKTTTMNCYLNINTKLIYMLLIAVLMLLKRIKFSKATKVILLCSNFYTNFDHILLYFKRYFPKYDLVNSNIIDNLHTIYLGVVKKIIEKAVEKKIFGSEANLSIIDDKMTQNFGTKEIERCGSIFMTANWKGKDFQKFLFFYGVPLCYTYSKNHKIINIFKLLSEAIFILSGRMINDDLLALADKKINDCLFLCTEIFGEYIITPNFHELCHLCFIIKKSGPLWLHSTFNFESLNNALRNCVIKFLGIKNILFFLKGEIKFKTRATDN